MTYYTSGVGDTIILASPDGSVTCGPYTLAGTSTTLMASGLVTSIGAAARWQRRPVSDYDGHHYREDAGLCRQLHCGVRHTAPSSKLHTCTSPTPPRAKDPTTSAASPIRTAGSGYQPETPITLTATHGSGAVAVANTTPATASQSYQPAYGAAPGYDLATGLGTPNAYQLRQCRACGDGAASLSHHLPESWPANLRHCAVQLTATDSACNLPITYSVVSGPASVAGSTLTITGAGSVNITPASPAMPTTAVRYQH